jgi:hypothetical protein
MLMRSHTRYLARTLKSVCAIGIALPLLAQQPAANESDVVRKLLERIEQLEARVASLEGHPVQAAAPEAYTTE